MLRRKFIASLISTVLIGVVSTAGGETILVDDFSDGDDDGWSHLRDIPDSLAWGPGVFDASSSAYHLASSGVVQGSFFAGAVLSEWVQSTDPRFANGTWRATVRINNTGTEAGFDLRFDSATLSGYVVGLDAPAVNPGAFFLRSENGVPVVSERISLSFPVQANRDYVLEVGTIDDLITVKAWPADAAEPTAPQFSYVDSTYTGGSFSVGAAAYPGWQTSATFDDITFTPVPEPSTALLGTCGATPFFFLHWRRNRTKADTQERISGEKKRQGSRQFQRREMRW